MSDVNVTASPSAKVVAADTGSSKTRSESAVATGKAEQAVQSLQQVNSRILDQRSRSAATMEGIRERLDAAIQTLNERMAKGPKDLSFSVDEVSKRYLVVVTDQSNGEVIRQVPAEAVLRVAHNIEALKGVLFDQVL
ncbi:MAG: flagellar protein FlaG [Pseudohongiellaceae bacterium]|jgi:flagellar protein FlaG